MRRFLVYCHDSLTSYTNSIQILDADDGDDAKRRAAKRHYVGNRTVEENETWAAIDIAGVDGEKGWEW